jgi:6-pyruvoyl-tetrahydropterin synthase
MEIYKEFTFEAAHRLPHAPPGQDPVEGAHGRLDDAHEWIVATPVVIEVRDGNVVKVITSP